MTGKQSPKNLAQSVRDQLLRISKKTGQEYQRVVLRYVAERLFARLAHSQFRDQFVLKGAMLFEVWNQGIPRATKDIDLLGFGDPDPERLRMVFQEVCGVTVEDDGLVFDMQSVQAVPIREDAIYDGVRITMLAAIGTMQTKVQIDVGFGDEVVPAPEKRIFPALIHAHGPTIKMYRPETAISEKLHAMVTLGMINSRMKDYFDIWFLSRVFEFDSITLATAIHRTFERRETAMPVGIPVGLSDGFGSDRAKQVQWDAFVRKGRLATDAPPLAEVVIDIRQFLQPLWSDVGPVQRLKWIPTGSRSVDWCL